MAFQHVVVEEGDSHLDPRLGMGAPLSPFMQTAEGVEILMQDVAC